MRTGRPKTTLTMSIDERAHLLAITRSRSLPAALTLRAKIVLACERELSQCRRGRCLQWARGEVPTSIWAFFYQGMTTPIHSASLGDTWPLFALPPGAREAKNRPFGRLG
jgi:hypothetical protein